DDRSAAERATLRVAAEHHEGTKEGVVQIRVTLETRNPLASAALAIAGVTRKQQIFEPRPYAVLGRCPDRSGPRLSGGQLRRRARPGAACAWNGCSRRYLCGASSAVRLSLLNSQAVSLLSRPSGAFCLSLPQPPAAPHAKPHQPSRWAGTGKQAQLDCIYSIR